MTNLTDYLDSACLSQLQGAFSAAAAVPLQICDLEGKPLVEQSAADNAARDIHEQFVAGQEHLLTEAPIVIGGKVVARIRMDDSADARPATASSAGPLMSLMADVLARLCEQRNLLRTRVEELVTLYRLTAEFTGQKDLDSLLDMVTNTVVSTLGGKASTIRLISEDRSELLIRAKANLSCDYLNKGPILLSESPIDQEVIKTLQPVYVADQRTDPRVTYPAESAKEGLVSSLCAPLVYQGRCEGVLRVHMDSVYEFDWFEMSLLQTIAANAAAAIVNARLHAEALHGAQLQRYLRLAAIVQRRMIPQKPPVVRGFEIGAAYVPCFELAGDFYDFIELPEDNIGIAICDVMGKGVRASLLMASLRASLRAHATEVYSMAEVIDKVNRTLCIGSLTSDFATLFYGVLDARSKRLTYTNAGHVPPMLVRDGKCKELITGGGLIGVWEYAQWSHESVILRSGDTILAYTDGLSEAMNFEDEMFGRHRIEEAVLEAIGQNLSAEGITKHVLWQMRKFAGLQQRFDDLTLVAIKTL